MKRFWQFGIVVLALVVLAGGLASCKDDKKKDSTTTDPTASTTDTGSSETPSDGEGDPGEVNQDDLDALAAEYGVKESKVAYTMETTSNGETTSGNMTFYWKPDVGWRVDFDMDGSTGSMISKGGVTYICTDEGDGTGTCIQSPVAQAPFPFFNYLSDPGSFRGLVGDGAGYDHSNETIAGKDADCFSTSAVGQVSSKYCFADGILLLVKSSVEGAGEFTFTATSVEEAVADADLEPPYPVQEIPTG